MLHSPSSFVEWISRLVIGYYFKEHEPNSLPKLYLLYALTGAPVVGREGPEGKLLLDVVGFLHLSLCHEAGDFDD